MLGGTIQGSNLSPTNGFIDLATIEDAPQDGEFSELTFPNDQAFRYVKYYSPDNSHGNIAELEFYAGEQLLGGAPFGSAGSGTSGGAGFEAALDGDPATFFDGALESGNYVGLDLGEGLTAQAPTFAPEAGTFDEPPTITLASETSGATLRYTTDGSNPSREHGEVYRDPVTLEAGRTQLKALAFADCLFDSPVSAQTYVVGEVPAEEQRGQKSYHIGNSLTDTINPWLEPIADSTGVDHVYARWTIPGAPPVWLWEHKGEGFEDPEGASDFDNFVRSFAPIDHMSVQPFADPNLETQGKAGLEMYKAALEHSPNLQFWIYAQWAPWTEWTTEGLSKGAPWQAPPEDFPPAPTSWESATRNQLLFHELYREYVDERAGGKSVLIVPSGLALIELKRQVEAGKVPGITNFYAQHFSDDLHLSEKGQYLVALVFYSCLYRQSPEGRVTFANTGLTEEQARIYQRIAWETARGYKWSGLTDAGAK